MKPISISKLLHNDRLMMIFSLVLAFIVWASVVYGPGNVETRTITIPVTVDLQGTYAEREDIRIMGSNTFTVEVQVQGTRGVIGSLDATDIRVKPNVQAIQGAGRIELTLTPLQNSKVNDYTFISVTPSTITVECDYWVEKPFDLVIDTSAVHVAPQQPPLTLGVPYVDQSALKNGKVVLDGPQSVISRIATVVARVHSDKALAVDTVFSAPLYALDSDGNTVDLSSCTFEGLNSGSIDITVPVLAQKQVDFTYEVKNAPTDLNVQQLVSLSKTSTTLYGNKTILEQLGQTLANLGTINFDTLLPQENHIDFPLILGGGLYMDPPVDLVTATVDLSRYTSKKIAVSAFDMVLINNPANLTAKPNVTSLSDVHICGPKNVLDSLTTEDLQIQIDASSLKAGITQMTQTRIIIKGEASQSCWVYYGTNGYLLSVTVQ